MSLDIPMANTANPANAQAKRVTEATRIPMSVPHLRLEVPKVPGYHLHWFLSQNIPRALKAGYTYVDEEEVDVVSTTLGNGAEESGSTDMGTRISVVAGGIIEGTTDAQRLYLMKLPEEWREKDMAALEAVNEGVAKALRSGNAPGPNGQAAADDGRKYMKTGQDLFYPKRAKAR